MFETPLVTSVAPTLAEAADGQLGDELRRLSTSHRASANFVTLTRAEPLVLTLHRGGTCFVVAVAQHAALTLCWRHPSPALSERLP